jgi:hypothetical protein
MDVATVIDWMKLSPAPAEGSPTYLRIERLLDGVVVTARRRCRLFPTDGTAPQPLPEATADWPQDLQNGLIMQVARLARRQSTPEGLAEFPDVGIVTIRRFDPDIQDQIADYLTHGF